MSLLILLPYEVELQSRSTFQKQLFLESRCEFTKLTVRGFGECSVLFMRTTQSFHLECNHCYGSKRDFSFSCCLAVASCNHNAQDPFRTEQSFLFWPRFCLTAVSHRQYGGETESNCLVQKLNVKLLKTNEKSFSLGKHFFTWTSL